MFKKYLLLLLGVVGAAPALADPIWYNNLFTSPKSDLSTYWLGQIFGSVGGMIPYEGPGLFPAVFQVFNAVMLIFVALMAVYGVVISLMNAAQQGSIMSKTMSSPFYPVRLIIGLAAVAPLPSGYSAVQMFIMWVILQGVGASNAVWSRALDYFAAGGTLASQSDSKSAMDSLTSADVKVFINNTYGAGACLAAAHNVGGGIGVAPLSPDYITVNPNSVAIDKCDAINFPNLNPNLSDDQKKSITMPVAQLVYQAAQASIAASKNPDNAETIKNQYALNAWDSYRNLLTAYTGMVQSNTDKAKNIADNITVPSSITRSESGAYVSGTGYGDVSRGSNLYDLGWANAGSFYHALASQEAQAQANVTINTVYTKPADLGPSISSLPIPSVPMPKNQNSLCSAAAFVAGAAMIPGNPPAGMFTLLSCGAMSAIAAGVQAAQYSVTGVNDPILHIMSMGSAIVHTTEVTMLAFITAAGVASMFAGGVWALGFNPVANIAIEASTFVPLLLGIMAPLLTVGYILLYYVPLVPFMIFATGVIGWLMVCIESMIAAPITMVGLVSPDGQSEVFGRAEPAIMLIFNTFLRPTLMIFGFLAAMLLSRVVFEVVNAGFFAALSFVGSTETQLSLFGGMVVIVMYNAFVVGLINKVYALIHLVPDKVMTWVGHHHASMINPDEILSGVKGGVSETVGTGSKFTGEMTKAKGEDALTDTSKQAGGDGITIGAEKGSFTGVGTGLTSPGASASRKRGRQHKTGQI
jgi:conjugal transfer/type IV secretion protein DotA/TraY